MNETRKFMRGVSRVFSDGRVSMDALNKRNECEDLWTSNDVSFAVQIDSTDYPIELIDHTGTLKEFRFRICRHVQYMYSNFMDFFIFLRRFSGYKFRSCTCLFRSRST